MRGLKRGNPDGYRVGAGDETRTRDIFLGKEVLYQLSYTRILDQAVGEALRQAKRGGKLEEFVGVARDFLDRVVPRMEGGYPRKRMEYRAGSRTPEEADFDHGFRGWDCRIKPPQWGPAAPHRGRSDGLGGISMTHNLHDFRVEG